MFQDKDINYMSIALELAEKGRGLTSPNPLVGAVVVKNGMIAGKGFHVKAGLDHAEINALREAGEKTQNADLYVTLEPCGHYGKTPPCAEAIIKSGIGRVFTAMVDPNPLVNGGGINRLKEKKIITTVGILEEKAKRLNEDYIKFITTGTPFVTLKLALTADGKIADLSGKSKWITGGETRKFVHFLRSVNDAVMVGEKTVIADNPTLNVRDDAGKNPLRIIVCSELNFSPDSNIFFDKNVILAVTDKTEKKKIEIFSRKGIEIIEFASENGMIPLKLLMKKLGERNIVSVLCEGGSSLASSLINEKAADKIILTVAPKIMGKGLEPFPGLENPGLENAVKLKNVEYKNIDDDLIITGYPNL